MVKLRMVVSFGVGLVFLAASEQSLAQLPTGPVTCPTSEVVTDVVCASQPLQEHAREVERIYFAAAANDWHETQRQRIRWQYEFLDCGHFIGQGGTMQVCISESFSRFALRLSDMAAPGAQNREQLFKDADVIMAAAEDMARQGLRGCTRREALALDDGVSSVRDIAVVVASRCRQDAGNVARLFADRVELSMPFMTRARTTPAGVLAVRESLVEPDALIELVLELRAAKRKGGRQARPARPP